MAKGLGILIAPAGKGKSMYEEDEGEESPPFSRKGSSRAMDNLRTILGEDADEEQLEALKDIIRECFEEYEEEPHKEGPHLGEEDETDEV